MSLVLDAPLQQNDQIALVGACNIVDLVIRPRSKTIDGLDVRRILPFRTRRRVGPFVFLDHMGPTLFSPEQSISIEAHPHIGLATLTYLFKGELLHRDSLGTAQIITPGAVNLMTAGRGIVHAEQTPADFSNHGGSLEGIQFWLALMEDEEECAPEFQHTKADDLPRITRAGLDLHLIIGETFGQKSPVTFSGDALLAKFEADTGTRIALPEREQRAVYIRSGRVRAGGTELDPGDCAVLKPQRHAVLEALEPSSIILMGGSDIGERHMWWNFVSSQEARIEQARSDWENGHFPSL